MDLLSKRELHGQNPIVTPCNKQSLSQFEMQSRKSETVIQTVSVYSNLLTEHSQVHFLFCVCFNCLKSVFVHSGTQSGQMSGEGKAGPPGGGRSGFPLGRGRGRFPGQPGPGGDRFPGPVGPGGPPPHFPGTNL